MQLFHGHQRDERRRRVLTDDRAADAAASTKTAAPLRTRKAEVYADGARLENHRRVSDLIPKSYLTIGLLFLVGLTAIAGLAAAHLYLPELASWGAKDGVAALELGGRGSLASWLSSLLFGLAGLTSMLIYSVRRHKLDDYRGHYRWWLVAAGAWMVMSIDATAGIHDLFRVAMTRLSGHSAPAAGHVWWIGCWGLVLTATVIRLLLDMRACRTALLTIVLAVGAWSAGLAIQFAGVQFAHVPAPLVAETLKLFGNLLLLLGVTLSARHVILHAQGLLPAHEPKPRKERTKTEAKAAASDNTPQVAKIDAAHNSTGSTDKRIDLGSNSASAANADRDDDASDYDEDDSGDRNRKLTKAERKRLRKQKSEDRGW